MLENSIAIPPTKEGSGTYAAASDNLTGNCLVISDGCIGVSSVQLCLEGRHGIIDTEGKTVVPIEYEEHIYTEDGSVVLKRDNTEYVFDPEKAVMVKNSGTVALPADETAKSVPESWTDHRMEGGDPDLHKV